MEHDERAKRIPSNQRFRQGQRLRSSRDFQRVRRHGRHLSGECLTLGYARQGKDAGETRVGFSVSKRVGNAVARNRVKRRLREITRRMLADLPVGWDIVLSAKPAAAAADYTTLAASIGDLFRRAGWQNEARVSQTMVK